MKILKGILLVIALSLVLYGIEGVTGMLPWWKVVFPALIAGLVMQMRGWKSFAFGFLAIAIWWTVFALLTSQANDGVLAGRIGQLFNGISSTAILLMTALIGGITGGLGALLGAHSRQLFSSADQ